MKSDYTVIHKSQPIGSVISRLHKEELLCVVIQDKGSFDDLLEAISWYKENMNFSIHVTLNNDREKLEQLTTLHPDITYIVFNRPVRMGLVINAIATECYSTYFLVARSDASLIRFDGGALIDLLRANEQISCICPVIRNQYGEVMPTVRLPLLPEGRLMRTECCLPDGSFDTNTVYDTLYPFWGLGLYKRAAFQRIRGMDEQIQSSFYQALDFGGRSWMFGFPLVTTNSLQMQFRYKVSTTEDMSWSEGTERCLAKLLGVRQVGGRNYLNRRGLRYRGLGRLMRDEVKPRLALYKTDWTRLCQDFRRPSV
ncbi:MAG: hypothetical protein J5785_01285 [Spirochaetales bacterium]|nr:hypothetical protein [Spirochaetales bacterium]